VGANEPKAAVALKARIDATTQGLAYQWAEVWLERNPGATAKELLLFLAERAEAARSEAIRAEMAAGGLDELDAAQLVDKYMDYRENIIRELDGG
jgi:hypothetical protein